jgi:hypothetical protein
MVKLAAAEPQREWDEAAAPAATAADAAAAAMIARVRLMMIIAGLTTLVAIAAVVGVVGYRVFHAGRSSAAPAQAIVTLPKGARVIGSAVAGEAIVVTLDVGGSTEIRTFDARTLKETGRIRFATEP